MDVVNYYKSLTRELESLKDRVRTFINDGHWLTDGEWKESVLRTTIARNLPDTVKIGRGFVLTPSGATTQCDILLYRSRCPILFKDGDLVFVTPDAVVGIIEVKSVMTATILRKTIHKFLDIAKAIDRKPDSCVFGIFSYENHIKNNATVLNMLASICHNDSQVINLMSLGCSTLIKWWNENPIGDDDNYNRWHSYKLENMSAGYFIHNIMDFLSPASVGINDTLWFPAESKEVQKNGEIALTSS